MLKIIKGIKEKIEKQEKIIHNDKRADTFERGPNKVAKLKSMVTEIKHSVEELSSWLDTLKKNCELRKE